MNANSGFDLLAPIYDSLARLVFGKAIVNSQTWFLNQVPTDANVLILGGGTGWLLEELKRRNPSCSVWYVEASSKMIERTSGRSLGDRVHLIHGTEEQILKDILFNVVITNFYLDLFSEEKLKSIVQLISHRTNSSSRWLVTDFIDGGKWWQRVMLKIMYAFFKSVCAIEANHLPNWNKILGDNQWIEVQTKSWYRSFIKGTVWQQKVGI